MNIFERAARKELRFYHLGKTLNTEDLFHLSLATLDDLAKKYHAEIKNQEETSFIAPEGKSDTTAQLCFDIVYHIIKSKLAAKEAAAARLSNKVESDKLLAALEAKDNDERSNMSREELLAALEKLND